MEKIFFLMERVYRMTHIPVRYLDKSGEMALFSMGYEPKDDPVVCDEQLRRHIVQKAAQASTPILVFEEDIVYGAFTDEVGSSVLLGPVCKKKLEARQVADYAHRHAVLNESIDIVRKTLGELGAALSTLFFISSGKYVSELDIIASKDGDTREQERREESSQSYILHTMEAEVTRFGFSDEMEFIQHIREGRIEESQQRANARLRSFEEEQVGKLAQQSFKQNEYMACSAIVLASRAAMEGGLDSMTAYLISDLYMQRLERCRDITEIYQLLLDMVDDYTKRVRQKRDEHTRLSYVEQCKAYIEKHLNSRFTIEDVADTIGINKSYLSRRFSEAVGMGIHQYTQQKRVEAAASMLKYSNESILAISEYLCFTSQSHFGRVFKAQMGITPQKYREQNRLMDS